ncbi:MAG: sulfotransferase [Streptosporangiaceae bacterium]
MQEPTRSTALKKALRRRSAHLAVAFGPAAARTRHRTTRPGESGSRLVQAPVFILSVAQADATLLGSLLNRHSRIHVPASQHLDVLEVRPKREYADDVMGALGLDRTELQHLLWDRMLHHQLELSGKDLVVDQTVTNTLAWPNIATAWPSARFVLLLRNPGYVVESALRQTMNRRENVIQEVLAYATGIEAARATANALTIRYEDLVAEPDKATRRICDFLGVAWQPDMLDHGQVGHGPVPRNAVLPPQLQDIAGLWGYLSA